MTNYFKLSQNSNRFLSLTCYTVEEFEALLPHFASKLEEYDKKVADESGYKLPEGSYLGQDTGFQWFEIPGVNRVQPKNSWGRTNNRRREIVLFQALECELNTQLAVLNVTKWSKRHLEIGKKVLKIRY